jgi:hypothetical protein
MRPRPRGAVPDVTDSSSFDDGGPPKDDARRARRLAEILDKLALSNRPLVPKMSEEQFRAMIQRMAEHQLIYEEYETGAG